MKYYLIAGEASGDLHGSNLMKALKEEDPEACFRCLGGDLMQQAGGTLVRHYRDMAYMGFIPVLTHLHTILGNMRRCKADIREWNPDVVILIDYPGFNLDIAKYLHAKTDIPVFYYISPKLWAWKEYRIRSIRRDVDAMFSILPFEVDYFHRLNYHSTYVGNPCVDAVEAFSHTPQASENIETFEADHHLPHMPIIALLAGSRQQEIRDNLPIMLQATKQFTTHQVVIAGAPGIESDYYRRFMPQDCRATVVTGETYRLLRHADAALVTSGTATLETALLRTAQVVCYYTAFGRLISLLRRMLLKVKYISLVNLIAQREVVKELVADQMTAEAVEANLRDIMPGGARRQQQLLDYDELAHTLGQSGASSRAARAMIKKLGEMKNEKRNK